MKYLKIQSSVRTYSGEVYEQPIAIVLRVDTTIVLQNSIGPRVSEGYYTQYVTVQYYKSIEAYLSKESSLTLTDNTNSRKVLYISERHLRPDNVHDEIALQLSGKVEYLTTTEPQ